MLNRSFIFILVLPLAAAAWAAEPGWPISLAQSQSLALERNHDLRQARAALASARANVLIAGAPPNPMLGISSGSISLAGNDASRSLWKRNIDTIVGVSQLIERGGKRALRTENAEHNVHAADADQQDVQRQLRLFVAQAYADLHAAQDRLTTSSDASLLLDATLAAAQTRRAAGDIAGADVERVRVDTLRARNDLVAAEAELRRARRALALLLGESVHADSLEAADSWPAISDAALPPEVTIERIIENRADVRAAVARVQAAASGTRYADALRTRDVSVGVQVEHFPQPGDPTSRSGNSIGLSVQMPLFTRYYYQGEIKSSQAALESASENLARVKEAAEAEISTAQSALRSAAERVRRNRDELLVAAEKAARAAEYAYQNGAVGVMDVLDARRTLRAIRLDALIALADFSKALASWQASTDTLQDSVK